MIVILLFNLQTKGVWALQHFVNVTCVKPHANFCVLAYLSEPALTPRRA